MIRPLCAVLAVIVLAAPALRAQFQPAGLLEIHYINVGQGGSTLIIGPDGTRILYDFGNRGRGDAIVAYLRDTVGLEPEDGIHFAMVSHRDQDHYGGYADVVEAGYDILVANFDSGSDKPPTARMRQLWLDPAARTTAGPILPIPVGLRIPLVINATNVQSGALWRFSRPYMADYRVGMVRHPTVALATAVAASSAFPPVLSPLHLEVDPSAYDPPNGQDLHVEPFTTDVLLTDGGVYDNLGLETAWKRYDTILVSDGGGKMQPEAEPKTDWTRHALRINALIDNQVRSLRKRQLIGSYGNGRKGTYWGIRSHVADYGLADPLPCPPEQTLVLANTKTRLKRLEPVLQERLINWGYAICDTAMRRWVDSGLSNGTFPYPGSGIGGTIALEVSGA